MSEVSSDHLAVLLRAKPQVQMATTVLCCEEANVPDAYRAVLREASDSCTIIADMITDRLARVIRNKLTDDLIASGLEAVSFAAQIL